MKKLLLISVIFMAICSFIVNAQTDQQKLKQVELMRKFLGIWQAGNGKDTIQTFEMIEYKNAFMQINTNIIKGIRRVSFNGYYTYDKATNSFKSFALYPSGMQQNWRTQFVSDKEAVFEFEDPKSNTVIFRNTCTFNDPDQVTGYYYNRDKVLTSSLKWVKISSDGVKTLGMKNQSEIITTGLNQLELAKKMVGVWQLQTNQDTVSGFEMSFYENAVLETMYRTFKGGKRLLGTISYAYDPSLDRFIGVWLRPDGRLDPYTFKFSSKNEVVFEWVEDFKSNKLLARNKFVFPDQDHMNGTYYNEKEVQYGSSIYVRTSSGR